MLPSYQSNEMQQGICIVFLSLRLRTSKLKFHPITPIALMNQVYNGRPASKFLRSFPQTQKQTELLITFLFAYLLFQKHLRGVR